MMRFVAIPAVIGKATEDGRELANLVARSDGDAPFVAILEEKQVSHDGHRACGYVDTVVQLGEFVVALGTVDDTVEAGEYGCGLDAVGGTPGVREADEVLVMDSPQFAGFTIYADDVTNAAWPEARVVVYEDPRYTEADDATETD